jgi:hypothetical protein
MQSISVTVVFVAAEAEPLCITTLNWDADLLVQYGPYCPGLPPEPVGTLVVQVSA